MRVLVTGATGFVGQHLVPFLKSLGHSVYGTSFSKRRMKSFPDLTLFRCDVRDGGAVRAIVREIRTEPDLPSSCPIVTNGVVEIFGRFMGD